MFAKACETAWKFTKPVVVETHCVDDKCRGSASSYVVVNDEGWILTAHHVLKMFQGLNGTVKTVAEYNRRVASIEGDSKLSARQKKQSIRSLGTRPPNDAAMQWSVWWG